jgi:hypothetical protein
VYTLHLNSDAGLGFRVRDRVPGAHLGTVFVHSPGAHSEKHSPMCLYIENVLGQWYFRISENFVPGAHSEKHSLPCLHVVNVLGQWYFRISLSTLFIGD